MDAKRMVFMAAVMAWAALAAGPALAGSAIWQGDESTLWSNGGNWDTGSAPGQNMGGGGSQNDVATFPTKGGGANDPRWDKTNGRVAGLVFQDAWTLTMAEDGTVGGSAGIDVDFSSGNGTAKITGSSSGKKLKSYNNWTSTIAAGDTLWLDIVREFNNSNQSHTWTGGGTVLLTKNFSSSKQKDDTVMTVTGNSTFAANAAVCLGDKGSGNKTTAFRVDSGSTLAGTGSIVAGGATGGRRVLVDGTLSPGWDTTATASLSLTSVQTFQLNGGYAVDINGAASDSVAAVDLNLGGSSLLSLNPVNPLLNTPYTIATYSGTLSGTFSNAGALPAGWSVDYGTGSDSAITVNYSRTIPEPATMTMSLLALGGLGATAVRRRGRREQGARGDTASSHNDVPENKARALRPAKKCVCADDRRGDARRAAAARLHLCRGRWSTGA
jgi:hypothetical protein